MSRTARTGTRHTPGNWRAGYVDEADRKNQMIVRAEDVDGQPYIAICPNPLCGNLEANAQLIAAAPDMLEAIKAFLLSYEGIDAQTYHPQVFADVLQSLRAAVAKAEGEAE